MQGFRLNEEEWELLRAYLEAVARKEEHAGLPGGESGQIRRLSRDLEQDAPAAAASSDEPAPAPRRRPPHSPDPDADARPKILSFPQDQALAKLRAGAGDRLFITGDSTTGDGGIGKTEFTRHANRYFALHALERLRKPAGESEPSPLVPIRAECGQLAAGQNLLALLLLSAVSGTTNNPDGLKTLLDKLLAAGSAVVIVDGLDELPAGVSARSLFQSFLAEIAAQDCPMLVAGRADSLDAGARRLLSPVGDRWTELRLRPLDDKQIGVFIRSWFGPRGHARAEKLTRAVTGSSLHVRPLLGQPFMLAMTCLSAERATDAIQLPDRPDKLLEEGLLALLERRGAAAKQLFPDPSQRMELSATEAFDALKQLAAFSCLRAFRFTQVELEQFDARLGPALARRDPTGKCRLSHVLLDLAPKCGVLTTQTPGVYRFTNRVIAEFLAGSYLAEHGPVTRRDKDDKPLPPDADGDADAASKSAADAAYLAALHIDPLAASNDAPSLLFYANHVWSDDLRPLLRWMVAGWWRRKEKVHLAEQVGWWLVRHVEMQPYGDEPDEKWSRDDLRQTLLHRYFDVLSAALPVQCEPDGPAHGLCVAMTTRVVYAQWPFVVKGTVVDIDSLKAVPFAATEPLFSEVMFKLVFPEMLEEEFSVTSIAKALARGWADNLAAGKVMRNAFKSQMEKEKPVHWIVDSFAEALASGWANDRDAGATLRAALQREMEKRTPSGWIVLPLAKALAGGWANDREAGTALRTALQREMKKDEPENWIVSSLAEALAIGWANDGDAGAALYAALYCEMEKKDPKNGTVSALASSLGSMGPEYQTLVGEALRAALRREMERQEPDYWIVSRLGKVWADRWTMHDVFVGDTLCTALKREIEREEPADWIVSQLVEVLTSGWANDRDAGEALRAALKCEVEKDEPEDEIISPLVQAFSGRWAEHGAFITDILRAALQREMEKPSHRIVSSLAKALGYIAPEHRAFAGEALRTALKLEMEKEEPHYWIVRKMAEVLAKGWANDRDAGEALREILKRVIENEQVSAFDASSLVEALAVGWVQHAPTAQLLFQINRSENLASQERLLFLPGPYASLQSSLADRCRWPLKEWTDDPADDRPPDTKTFWLIAIDDHQPVDASRSEDESKQDPAWVNRRAVVMAPRDAVRRGLDPALFHDATSVETLLPAVLRELKLTREVHGNYYLEAGEAEAAELLKAFIAPLATRLNACGTTDEKATVIAGELRLGERYTPDDCLTNLWYLLLTPRLRYELKDKRTLIATVWSDDGEWTPQTVKLTQFMWTVLDALRVWETNLSQQGDDADWSIGLEAGSKDNHDPAIHPIKPDHITDMKKSRHFQSKSDSKQDDLRREVVDWIRSSNDDVKLGLATKGYRLSARAWFPRHRGTGIVDA